MRAQDPASPRSIQGWPGCPSRDECCARATHQRVRDAIIGPGPMATTRQLQTMRTAQAGILALGHPSQAYLELDLLPGRTAAELVAAAAALREPRTTPAGVNLVIGFRPELWRAAAPADAPGDVKGFDEPVTGVDGFSMPATQHDALLWVAGSAYDSVFDNSRLAVAALSGVAQVATETVSWAYRGNRDLTGFEDGTENPSLPEAPAVALVPPGRPGEGGSVLLLQKWILDAARWEALPVGTQETVIGRRKSDSVELENKSDSSHVARTDQDTFGDILRRNMPIGNAGEHGTMFVGFCATQQPLARMLDSMAGKVNGKRDSLTRFLRATSGAYYFVPAAECLMPAPKD